MTHLDHDQHQDLVKALMAGQPAHLIHENAEFVMRVEMLARLLPSMVNGIALDCHDHQTMSQQQMERLMLRRPARGPREFPWRPPRQQEGW